MLIALESNAGDKPPYYWLVPFLGLLLITLSLMMRLRKRHRQRASMVTPQEKIERMRQLRGMRGDLEGLMVEIDQMAKRISAQLDAKAIELERLIDEADRKIARFKVLRGEGTRNLQQDTAGFPAVPDDPLAKSVYDLADKGVEPANIASRLGEHIGKIELILALRSA